MSPLATRPAQRVQPQIDFVRDIEPIFKQYCTECHGPTKARARLRLHSPDTILKGGLSGAPIDPGKSEQSLLIRRVLGLDGEDQMPLDRDPLPDALIARLRAWVDAGALMPGATTESERTAMAAAPAKAADPEHWSVHQARASCAADDRQRQLAAERHRSIRARQARARKARALA